MADWHQVYRAVVCENGTALLVALIHQFEDVTCRRMQELAANPDPIESRDIQSALRHVLNIKAERLGWPDPRKVILSRDAFASTPPALPPVAP